MVRKRCAKSKPACVHDVPVSSPRCPRGQRSRSLLRGARTRPGVRIPSGGASSHPENPFLPAGLVSAGRAVPALPNFPLPLRRHLHDRRGPPPDCFSDASASAPGELANKPLTTATARAVGPPPHRAGRASRRCAARARPGQSEASRPSRNHAASGSRYCWPSRPATRRSC